MLLPEMELGDSREDRTDSAVGGPLRASGLVDADGLERARQFQKLHGGLLADALLRLELVKENDFLRVFADIYSTRFVRADKLATLKIEDGLLSRISARDCERLRVCPVRWDDQRGELHLVAAAPLPPDLSQELKRITAARSTLIYIATAGAVHALVRRWHYREKDSFEQLTPNGAGPLSSLPRPALGEQPPATTEARSNEAMVQQLKRENERLRLAQEFSRRVTLERSQDAMMNRIVDVLFELLAAETAVISLQNGKYLAKTRHEGKAPEVPRSVLEKTLSSQSGILVNNALIDQRFDRSQSVMLRGIKSIMAVPLKARDKVLGVLYVDSVSQSAAFGERDLPLLESIAGQAAMFLDNANLIAEVAREVENRVNLSRFLPATAVEEVLSGRLSVKLDGQAAEVTLLFADIRGFTELSRELPPEQVVRFLNDFFAEMVDAVEQYGGVVDKFMGDCVMALWGAPEPKPTDARNALKAAVAMVNRARGISVNGRPLEVGVGVHTGGVVLGCIGSARRVDFTAIGSSVNLASRLCSAAGPGQVLTLANTLERCEQTNAQAREPIQLKGYSAPVTPFIVTAVDDVKIGVSADERQNKTLPSVPMNQPHALGTQPGVPWQDD